VNRYETISIRRLVGQRRRLFESYRLARGAARRRHGCGGGHEFMPETTRVENATNKDCEGRLKMSCGAIFGEVAYRGVARNCT
jgi:hypothetical protein